MRSWRWGQKDESWLNVRKSSHKIGIWKGPTAGSAARGTSFLLPSLLPFSVSGTNLRKPPSISTWTNIKGRNTEAGSACIQHFEERIWWLHWCCMCQITKVRQTSVFCVTHRNVKPLSVYQSEEDRAIYYDLSFEWTGCLFVKFDILHTDLVSLLILLCWK